MTNDLAVADFVLEEAVTTVVAVEPLALEEEFVRVPSDLAFWNERFARAQRAVLLEKAVLERVEAELSELHRGMLKAAGKATDAMVEERVHRDPTYQRQKKAVADAEYEKLRAYGVVDAIRTKRDMIISLGAHIRAEMARDPVVRDKLK